MTINVKRYCVIGLAALTFQLLTGCHTPPTTIYEWSDYQPQVYRYFKGGSPDEQIQALEKAQELFKAHNTLAPPGFHAHLGMLYASVGKGDLGQNEFMTEKKLFPESAAYMDFLMNKTIKKDQ